jgi:hypothetical protein
MIKLKAISTAVLALFFVNSAIADQNAATEQITSAAWIEALENAARLSGDLLHVEDARPVEIIHLPIEEIYDLTGLHLHACAYDRATGILYCRDDRPWITDHGHHGGIVVHEAAHAMQPDSMPIWLREIQAYLIQIAWLEERGKLEHVQAVVSNMKGV